MMKATDRGRCVIMEQNMTRNSALPQTITEDEKSFSKIEETLYCSSVKCEQDYETGLPVEVELTRETFDGQVFTKKYVLVNE